MLNILLLLAVVGVAHTIAIIQVAVVVQEVIERQLVLLFLLVLQLL
jgi:hypothetical protein